MLPVLAGKSTPWIFYVDATLGDDDNDGTSPATAWQTVAKVNAATLLPGQRVLFKRGGTFAGQLTPTDSGESGNPITYGAYGVGAHPIIDGSAESYGFYNIAYNFLRLEHLDFAGSNERQPLFSYDTHGHYIYDCIIRDSYTGMSGLYVKGYNITFEDCEIKNNYKSGALLSDNTNYNILFLNCNAHDNGHDVYADHGFYIAGGVTLDGCTATDNSGAGFKMNDNDTEPSHYPVVKNSNGSGNNYGLLFTHKNAEAYNNLLVGNLDCNLLFYGNPWGGYKCYFNTLVNSVSASERGMVFTSGVSANSEVKNNIIVQDQAVITLGAMHTTIAMATLAANYDIDYNLYYTAGGNAASLSFGYDDTDIAEGRQSWNDWQGAGHDAHSTFLANTPDFVTRYTDLHPAAGGDLKAKGVAIAGYMLDKDGNTRADPPTQGCYEEAAA
jgi:hypothetical protein